MSGCKIEPNVDLQSANLSVAYLSGADLGMPTRKVKTCASPLVIRARFGLKGLHHRQALDDPLEAQIRVTR
ncbi:unannotated protein [freshwater metagenome]|uniref:Unannotated protein n=1 Tax=freshwater metagenome TaxID=449393 RepID=A0A6J7JHM3_9ZZZZ